MAGSALILLVIFLLLGITSGSDTDPAQQSALISFWDSLTSKGLLDWDTSVSLCGQSGVKCADQKVVQLSLGGLELQGTFPSEIGALTSLTWLDIENNQFTGSLPTEIGNLKSLLVLGLHENAFSGSIPTEVGKLKTLVALALHQNSFSGQIPREIGRLTLLQGLSLHSNELSGTIPSEFGRLVSLPMLNFQKNKLTGTIPTTIARLQALSSLNLSFNQLSGSIPKEIGKIETLEELFLSNNEIGGTIPEELGNLSLLTGLNLANNQLTGTIPSALRGAPALAFLDLSSNRLTGNIPQEMKTMSFWILNLANNELCYANNYSAIAGETDIDKVEDHCSNCIKPCQNGGTCFTEGKKFGCHCPVGYVGFNCDNYLPLHWACTHGSTKEIAHLLLSKGVSGSDLDPEGRTPAWLCALNGQHEVLKTLLESKINLNLNHKTRVKHFDGEPQTAFQLATDMAKKSEAHRLVEQLLKQRNEL